MMACGNKRNILEKKIINTAKDILKNSIDACETSIDKCVCISSQINRLNPNNQEEQKVITEIRNSFNRKIDSGEIKCK